MGDVLIVGATGKVGRNLVEALVSAGVTVRAATRRPAEAKLTAGAKIVRFDLADTSTFDAALEGTDRIFLIATPGQLPAHVLAEPFLRAAFPRVQRIVVMTAAGAGENPDGPDRRLELLVEQGAKEWTHLRPGSFLQNFNTRQLATIKATGRIRVPAGDGKIAFIDTRDIADCAVAALTKDGFTGHAFVLTGGEAIGYGEVAQVLSRETGASIAYENIGEDEYREQVTKVGLPPPVVNQMVAVYARIRAGDTAFVTDNVRKLTGHAPRTVADYARAHRHDFV